MKIFKLVLGILLIITGCIMLLGFVLEINNQPLIEGISLAVLVGVLPIVGGIILLHSVLQFRK